MNYRDEWEKQQVLNEWICIQKQVQLAGGKKQSAEDKVLLARENLQVTEDKVIVARKNLEAAEKQFLLQKQELVVLEVQSKQNGNDYIHMMDQFIKIERKFERFQNMEKDRELAVKLQECDIQNVEPAIFGGTFERFQSMKEDHELAVKLQECDIQNVEPAIFGGTFERFQSMKEDHELAVKLQKQFDRQKEGAAIFGHIGAAQSCAKSGNVKVENAYRFEQPNELEHLLYRDAHGGRMDDAALQKYEEEMVAKYDLEFFNNQKLMEERLERKTYLPK